MKIIISDSNFRNNQPEQKVLSSEGLVAEKFLCKTEEDLIVAGKDADAVMVQFAPVTRKVLESWTKCKIIVRYGIGVDNVDIQAAEQLGIQVCNVPSYCLDEVADHTCALLLACARKLMPFHEAIKNDNWNVESIASPMPKFSESIVGLLGYGRIGMRVCERLQPFGFQIKVFDPYLNEQNVQGKGLLRVSSLKDLLSESDFVSLHVPLSSSTKHIMNLESFRFMKKHGFLINTSRGGLVDTQALTTALQTEQIGGAALDVYDEEPIPIHHPLLQCKNVLLTPHAAYYSDSALITLQHQTAEEVIRWIKGEPLLSPVNRPTVPR